MTATKTLTLVKVKRLKKRRGLVLTGETDPLQEGFPKQTFTYLVKLSRFEWGLLIRPAMLGLLMLDGQPWLITDMELREKMTRLCLKFGGVTHE